MSYAVWVAAAVTAALFAADWWAVWHRRADVERLAKPAAMVGLFSVALLAGATDSTGGSLAARSRWRSGWSATCCCWRTPRAGSSVGWRPSSSGTWPTWPRSSPWVSTSPALGWLGVLVLLVALVVGRRILPGAVADGGAGLGVAVAAYMAVIGAMAVTGWATGRPLVGLGREPVRRQRHGAGDGQVRAGPELDGAARHRHLPPRAGADRRRPALVT